MSQSLQVQIVHHHRNSISLTLDQDWGLGKADDQLNLLDYSLDDSILQIPKLQQLRRIRKLRQRDREDSPTQNGENVNRKPLQRKLMDQLFDFIGLS